jgi:3',5'-cyclic AMP phosphodiesterase CpdA
MKKGDRPRRDFLRTAALCSAAIVAAQTGLTEEFTFVQICDTQLGMGGYEHDVNSFKQAVKQINALKPDFVVICGDLVDKAEESAFADFMQIKAGFAVPCYCAAGNHDIGNSPTAESLEHYRKAVGKDYYSFEHKGYTFVVANASLWKAPVDGESEKHDAWFEETLDSASEKGSPVFVVAHYPLYITEPDEGEDYFNLPVDKRGKLLALFEQHGVVAVLAGHTHKTIINDYKGIQLVNGETTSKNFDERPLGFRLWHVGGERPFTHEFIRVEGFD